MFFFFIGGIQPKTVRLDDNPRICPVCGLNRAVLKRIDHYLTLFFIPLFRVKKGKPFLECPACGPLMREEESLLSKETSRFICPFCKRDILPEYKFCPFCGNRII